VWPTRLASDFWLFVAPALLPVKLGFLDKLLKGWKECPQLKHNG
jgi:hypothetical protein